MDASSYGSHCRVAVDELGLRISSAINDSDCVSVRRHALFFDIQKLVLSDCRSGCIHGLWLFLPQEALYASSNCGFSSISMSPASLTFGKTSVAIVSAGVLMTTLSRPSSTKKATDDSTQYFLGVGMLAVSSLLTGALGVLQEQTYHKYGPCWRESVFYTVSDTVCQCCYFSTSLQHFLSLPIYALLASDIKQGIRSLSKVPSSSHSYGPYIVMAGNMVTQLICVSGVNRLTSVGKISLLVLANF